MADLYQSIKDLKANNQCGFFLLLDPDKLNQSDIKTIVQSSVDMNINGFLVGSSLLIDSQFEQVVQKIKSVAENCPIILFPGNSMQVSPSADAILFLSLVSGRNPEYLINQQVLSAPMIKKSKIESIPTAYMLIESGVQTSVEFMSNTRPIPRAKTDIAVAHAIAAEMLGFKLIYLEAGSGAKESVPTDMIAAISHHVDIPVIVGGGIKDAATAKQKADAGASIVVCGTLFEDNQYHTGTMQKIVEAVKQ